ncbi:hypothetical protein AB8880_04720 [Alphaproteobacteria bacterium LSUCC0684]
MSHEAEAYKEISAAAERLDEDAPEFRDLWKRIVETTFLHRLTLEMEDKGVLDLAFGQHAKLHSIPIEEAKSRFLISIGAFSASFMPIHTARFAVPFEAWIRQGGHLRFELRPDTPFSLDRVLEILTSNSGGGITKPDLLLTYLNPRLEHRP